jgi:hypothetical protein
VSFTDAVREMLTALGAKRWFQIAVAAVLSLVVGAASFVTYSATARIDGLMKGVPELIRDVNLKENNPIARQLAEKGTLDYGQLVLGNEAFAARFQGLFNDEGRLEQIGAVTATLVGTQVPDWLPRSFVDAPQLPLGLGLIALAVINFAAFSGLAVPLVTVVLASTVLAGVTRYLGRADLSVCLAAIPALLLAFALLIRALLMLLDRASPVLAVAVGVIREAMRLRIAVVFAAVAIIAIPLLPQWIDPSAPLRYQVQTFLSRSLDAMYLVCALLTVFFACATVAFEIRDRQAWMTLTKPVSRISWLTGKWLGIVILNAAILSVCTLAMVVFLAQMRARPSIDIYDRAAVREEVLVARAGGSPVYRELPPNELEAAVKELIAADPNARADIEEGRRTELEVQKTIARVVYEGYLSEQRSIGPGEEESYTFTGLGAARELGAMLTLKYKF